MNIESAAVFCGSSGGSRPEYTESAAATGKILACRKIDLVFGGGNVGLMGAISNAALENGARVTGVITERIARMAAPTDGIRLITTGTMHERKQMMYDLCDAFLILPGGIGTLEEAFEVCTWNQLGYMSKPVCFLNTLGFYTRLKDFLAFAVKEGFLKNGHYSQILFADTPEKAIDKLISFEPEYINKL